jgi:transposase InsO family protein
MSRNLKPATANMSGNLKTLYYAPDRTSGFSSLGNHALASPRTKRADAQTWLLKQDSYTLHRPARKRFLRNPYNVTNIFDVWECDLIDIHNFSKYDKYRYLLSVIDVFSKFLDIVPLRAKVGTAVASAFRSILAKYSHRRPIWLRTDRGKEFLNRSFQDVEGGYSVPSVSRSEC